MSKVRPASGSMAPVVANINMAPNHKGQPTKFGKARAEELRDAAKEATKYDHWISGVSKVATPGEIAYVHAVWDAIPSGASSFATAFFAILNGFTD